MKCWDSSVVERPALGPDGRRFEPCSQLLRTSANHRIQVSGGGKSVLEFWSTPTARDAGRYTN